MMQPIDPGRHRALASDTRLPNIAEEGGGPSASIPREPYCEDVLGSFDFLPGSHMALGSWRPQARICNTLQATCDTQSHAEQSRGSYGRPSRDHFLVLAFCIVLLLQYIGAPVLYHSHPDVNSNSIVVVTYGTSLMSSLTVSVMYQGRLAFRNFRETFLRFLGISALFTVASICIDAASSLNASWGVIQTIGYTFLPAAALLSSVLLPERKYGPLEWLAMIIMTLAITTFTYLRSQGHGEFYIMKGIRFEIILLIIVASVTSAAASILAEGIYKNRSPGTRDNSMVASLSREPDTRDDSFPNSEQSAVKEFYIYKMHLDLGALLVSALFWLVSMLSGVDKFPIVLHSSSGQWFGPWHWKEFCRVAVTVVAGWLAGLITKRFSTVFRSIADTLCQVLIVFIFNPLFLGDRDFESGMLPCALLAIIILVAAVVFQIGRQNVEELFRSMQIPHEGAWFQCKCLRRFSGTLSQAQLLCSEAGCVSKYGALVMFVLSDAGRTLSQQKALSESAITPASMVLACYICGVLFASILTLYQGGYESRQPWQPASLPPPENWHDRLKYLRMAFDLRRVIQYGPSSFLFASASTLMALAYASGISAALATALGYVYMPVSALASRFFLEKYHCGLEWLGLLALTLTCATFGYLQNHFSASENPCNIPRDDSNSLLAMFLVVASAVVSVLASLVSEKRMKSPEEKSHPFHMQKVRLDLGSVICSLFLLVVIGIVSSRAQDAYWKQRPLDPPDGMTRYDCREHNCTIRLDDCSEHTAPLGPCGSGVFVAWGNWLVWLALIMNVFQGWMKGVIIKRLSVVESAIAQAITILLIYFVGDPIFNPESVQNLPLTMVALIIPLSTTIINIAKAQVQKVVQAHIRMDAETYILKFTDDWRRDLAEWLQHVHEKEGATSEIHRLVVTTRCGKRLQPLSKKGLIAPADCLDLHLEALNQDDFPLMIEYHKKAEPASTTQNRSLSFVPAAMHGVHDRTTTF